MRQAFFFNTPIATDHVGEQLAEIYKDRVYEPYLRGKRDLTILDVGAMGYTSYYFADFAKVVYAFEPNQESYDTLVEMLEFNKNKGWQGNVIPLKMGISNTDGEATLYHTPGNKTMTSFNPSQGFSDGSTEVVKTTRLDTFLKENNIEHVDFMKLDVEGTEDEILCGEGFQLAAPKIDMIIAEFHVWTKRNLNQVKDAMRQAGYTIEQIPNDASLWVAKRI